MVVSADLTQGPMRGVWAPRVYVTEDGTPNFISSGTQPQRSDHAVKCLENMFMRMVCYTDGARIVIYWHTGAARRLELTCLFLAAVSGPRAITQEAHEQLIRQTMTPFIYYPL